MSQYDAELLEQLASYVDDPLGFVLWAFPWGEEGTELARVKEPYRWQMSYFESLGDRLSTTMPTLSAVSSGHGTGKSALASMESIWAISTMVGARGVITANTEGQLKTKTWVELSKWFRLFIANKFFEQTATALFSRDPQWHNEWRLDMTPWSEQNAQAFAGLHNEGKRVFVKFDEASTIADLIWTTTEGALTDKDTEILWSVQGNPTETEGRFRECFEGGKFAHRWTSMEVNAETVPGVNREQLRAWEKDHGRDSNFYRIRVLGKFPKGGSNTFISRSIAQQASERQPSYDNPYPIILGVDVGRYGLDPTIIYPRKGFDARSLPVLVRYGLSNVQVATLVQQVRMDLNARYVVIDANGFGAGVYDILEDWGEPVYSFMASESAHNVERTEFGGKYANRKAEVWGVARKHLPHTAIIDEHPDYPDQTLVTELAAPRYDYDRNGNIRIEPKDQLVKRGITSTNLADAFTLTYAIETFPEHHNAAATGGPMEDYNPYAEDRIY